MDIQLEKLALIKLLAETEDAIIKAVKKIFQKEQKDFWEELTAEQKEALEEGINDADEGRVAPYENFMKKYL